MGSVPILALVGELRDALQAKDGPRAESLSSRIAAALPLATSISSTVREELAVCERLTREYFAELERALQGSATSNRAVRAYDRGEP